jgi:uncharacterized protein (TIGR00106 family)
MVMELTIIPLGSGRSLSGAIADLVKIIEGSGLDYRMTAFGTLIEGTWDQLIDVAKRCHFETPGEIGTSVDDDEARRLRRANGRN